MSERTTEEILEMARKEIGARKAQGIAERSNRDRRTFLAGVMAGFYEKLKSQRREHKEQGMVWIGDADLEKYYRGRHPLIQHTRYVGNARTEAHAQGREAGRKIVLHRPVEGGAGPSVKLLPSKS